MATTTTAAPTLASPAKKQKVEESTGEDEIGNSELLERKFQSILWKAGGLMDLEDLKMVLRRKKKTTCKDQSLVKLGYFPIRALAFLPQLILEESGVSYEFHMFSGKSFRNMKNTLPFGRMPVFFDWYGKGNHLVQSGAMIRALSKKVGLAGTNSQEQSICDMLFEQLKEAFGRNNYSTSSLREGLKAGDDFSTIPCWKEMARVNEYSLFQKSMAALHIFEKRLQNNASNFLVGAHLTYMDLALWSKLLELSQPDNVPEWADKLQLPHLNKLYSNIKERPNIKALLQSGRMLPRIGEGYKFKPGIFCKPTDKAQTTCQ